MKRKVSGLVLFLGLATAGASAACGGDKPGEPSDVSVAGVWNVEWNDMRGGGVTCQATQVLITLLQAGSELSGHYDNGVLTCQNSTGYDPRDGDVTFGIVQRGSVDGRVIEFDLGTSNLHQSGTVDEGGNTMSGTATWHMNSITVGGATLTGSWLASRVVQSQQTP